MADIQYIHNITSVATFGTYVAPGPANPAIPVWDVPLTGIPDVIPDECVIRSISFNGSVVDTNAYLIWCNLKNDFIGSFCGGNIASSSPNTRIRLNAPIPNVLHFALFTPQYGGLPVVPANPMLGDLIIHMDLIKYRRVAPHA